MYNTNCTLVVRRTRLWFELCNQQPVTSNKYQSHNKNKILNSLKQIANYIPQY
ncbi:hypothetical protein ES705_28088 [subsurface metagenome]